MKRITIEPVSRIEGHAKVTIQMDDAGNVSDTRFQVTQVCGFEKFSEGRPFYEMPGITSRICGMCPISHQLAASKACDAIMAVRIPKAARLLREIIHCGQFVQSHALSFFYLSGPDLLLGMDADQATRNVAGPIEASPEVARAGNLQLNDGPIRFRDAEGEIVQAGIASDDYADYIGESSMRESYLKAPYYKPLGYPAGIYRVGPLGRINIAAACGTPLADAELQAFRDRFGRMPHSAFLYHYARLIEVLYALERMKVLLEKPEVTDSHVRANAGVNALEGVGIIEAPRGTLIHHYKVDENGAIVWANLIVATGHNNYAIGKSVRQVSEHFVKGNHLEEGMLNRVSAVVRAYDPCLSCSTHATGMPEVSVALIGADGTLLDEICS